MFSVMNCTFDDHIPNWYNRAVHVPRNILAVITHGRVIYELNERKFVASKGDIVFIPTGTRREAYNDGSSTHQKYAVFFECAPPVTVDIPLLSENVPKLIRNRAFDFVRERVASIYRNHLDQRSHYRLINAGILTELLGVMSREMEAGALPKRKVQAVEEMKKAILASYRETISIQHLALQIGKSPNYAITLFKEAVGQTPLEYQHRLRMTTAMELLKSTELTITEIAAYLGYYDSSYFYKMFRKATGMSPSAYARK